MDFNAEPIRGSEVASEALLDFASAVIDMLTNVSAVESNVAASAGSCNYADVLARVSNATSGLDSDTSKDESIAFLLGNAFRLFSDTTQWRTSVSRPSEDWVSHYTSKWRALSPRNETMESIINLLAQFPIGSPDRVNLMRHVTHVTEQAVLIFAYRASPISRKVQQRERKKESNGRKKKVSAAIASHEQSQIMGQVAEHTNRMCSNPDVVRRMTEMARSLAGETLSAETIDQNPEVLDDIVKMSMQMAPTLVSSVTQRLNGGSAREVEKVVGKIGRKRLEKLVRQAATTVK